MQSFSMDDAGVGHGYGMSYLSRRTQHNEPVLSGIYRLCNFGDVRQKLLVGDDV